MIQKLPIGIQSFEIIRENGYLYVDKTEYIHRMVSQGIFYFISRPRRFGKSLLVSTLKCLFQGRQELFDGLWITKHTDEWKEHPIILIDFNGISNNTSEELRSGLKIKLNEIAQNYQISLEDSLLKEQFGKLITALSQQTQMPVIILIDEYDKPIIDHLGRGEVELEAAKANREVLKSFFGVLKDGNISPLLGFVFLTGISRFSKVSIFSELNNLNDITMSKGYAEALGYTPQELSSYFKERIEMLAKEFDCSTEEIKERLSKQYNGYRFSEKDAKVYNPFSILKSFSDMDFKDYWFETGTPTFLINLLRERDYELPKIEKMSVEHSVLASYELDDLRPEALLFQTGYVTIKEIDYELYSLGYPNLEVKISFLKHLLYSFTHELDGEKRSKFVWLSRHLQKEDFQAFFDTVKSIFASIPYTLNTRRDEAYFHTLFYLMVSASGADTQSEVITSRGRIDLVVEFADKLFIIEFKCDQSAEIAIKQIRDKGYAEKYKQSGKKLFIVGVDFSPEERNVRDWSSILFA